MARVARLRLPLTGEQAERQAKKGKSLFDFGRQFAQAKPERKLAGPHIHDKISLRQPVQLCEMCWRKDYGWWRRVDYRPNWDMHFMSDCHNCSRRFVNVYLFIHEGNFYSVLHPDNHGNMPEPNRKVYF